MDANNTLTPSAPAEEQPHHAHREPFIQGPRGAFILSVVSAGLLFIGWLIFYFLIFMRRGYVG